MVMVMVMRDSSPTTGGVGIGNHDISGNKSP